MKNFVFTYLDSKHEIEASSFEHAYVELVELVGAEDAGLYNLTK